MSDLDLRLGIIIYGLWFMVCSLWLHFASNFGFSSSDLYLNLFVICNLVLGALYFIPQATSSYATSFMSNFSYHVL
ncbi:MAG TPA: hypothetical protein PL085_19490, partial [Agriterribacter sp.]|nr:hypothetical protein [Agriterribacter sp.]